MHEQRGVSAVVENHVRTTLGPVEHLLGAPPVLLERLALPGVHGDPLRVLWRTVRAHDNRGRGMVLSRENVAGRPANVGAECSQRLDQNRCLNGHVERSGDACSGERLGIAVFLAHRNQAGHFVLGQANLIASELREG